MTAPPVTGPGTAVAESVVRRLTGLVFPEARRNVLASALQRGIQRAGEVDLTTYLGRLEAEPLLLDELVAEITVGETYFFRDPGQFEVVRQVVLPDLLRGRASRPLRLWSAGCASGEEPFTLAIILQELGLGPSASVLGTDISRAALTRAHAAGYGRWSLRGVSPDVVRRYFKQSGAAHDLSPEVRRLVEFRYLNLARDAYPSLTSGTWGMDLIFCRNVLIYLGPETVARVAEGLMAALAPDGWLLIGASDPPLGGVVPCEVVMTEAGLAYRRPRRRPTLLGVDAPRGSTEWDAGAWARPALDTGAGGPLRPAPATRAGPGETFPRPSPLPAVSGVAARAADGESDAVPLPLTGGGAGAEIEEAMRAYAAREYDLAAHAASRVTDRPGAPLQAWVILVRSQANAGQLEAAGRSCALALDRQRDSAELLYLHGLLLGEAGRPSEAARALRQALYLDRELVMAHLALAGARGRMGDVPGAGRALQNAERLLARLPAGTPVPASDGELAGRLLQVARAQLVLLSPEAA